MYSKQLESLIKAAMTDGLLTESEREILYKKADAEGVDRAEFEMVLESRLAKRIKDEQTRLRKENLTLQKVQLLAQAEKEKKEREENEQAKREKEEALKTKKGTIRKCPACGALVPTLVGKCPECGFEFTNVSVTSSSKELFEKIDKINTSYDSQYKKYQKIALLVDSFPIPFSKEDIFEFMVSARVKFLNKVREGDGCRNEAAQVMEAYFKKYVECMSKVEVAFANDKAFAKLISSYEQDCKKAKKMIWLQKDHTGLKVLIGLGLMFLPILLLLIALW